MNADRVFIDTNIFVYAKLKSAEDDQRTRAAALFLEEIEADVIISIQVINEFSSVLLKHKVQDEVIRSAIRELVHECTVCPVLIQTVEAAWDIRKKYAFSYWDCLIVSSALENQCDILFTEDLQHNQVIENHLRIINPFKSHLD